MIFRRADGQGAVFSKARLEGADFDCANLADAVFDGAHLQGARLLDADLHNARLVGAELPGVNLRNADLTNSLLMAADLSGVELDNANLCGADQGSAGGYKFSGVTLSVQALRGEAPLTVKDQHGRNGLTVRSNGDVHIDGSLMVYGQKRFVQAQPGDPGKVISYVALEGPEAGTYCRGSAELVGGEAVIELPDHFALVTAEEGLTVTATPQGGWLELFVAEKSAARIVVREASGRSGAFDYLVQGVRRGHETVEVVGDRGGLGP